MRWPRYLFIIPLLVGALAAGWVAYRRYSFPNMAPYERYTLATGRAQDGVTLRYFGASTLLIEDGETAIMSDGFLSRPTHPFRILFGVKIAPDRPRISRVLEKAGVRKLAAVFVSHSHYDHAMDAPEVARLTGAKLVGSSSTANIGRGWKLPEDQIVVVESERPMRFGKFSVTMIPSRHAQTNLGRMMLEGDITKPLVPPQAVFAYKAGETYSLLVEHPSGSLLVQGTAGYLEGALDDYRADVALISVGTLAHASRATRREYYRQTVEAVGAKLVVPIHWDDFTVPLDRPMLPQPMLFDHVSVALDFLVEQAASDPHTAFAMLPPLEPVAIFEALK